MVNDYVLPAIGLSFAFLILTLSHHPILLGACIASIVLLFVGMVWSTYQAWKDCKVIEKRLEELDKHVHGRESLNEFDEGHFYSQYVLVIVAEGQIQSISVEPTRYGDICVVVKDLNGMNDSENRFGYPDEDGNLCAWSFWEYDSLGTVPHDQVKFIQKIQEQIAERSKKTYDDVI